MLQPQTSQETDLARKVQDLEALYKEALRELATTSQGLEPFGEYVFGLRPAPHHSIWLKVLEDERIRHAIIIAPPGHAKSTWCSIVYPAWRVGRDPTIHYIGTSITATQANLFSVAIRDTIAENPRFGQIFPKTVPDRRKGWGESEWFVGPRDVSDPHSTYAAAGVGGAVIGRRADEIGLDDPYDEKTSATDTQRAKVLLWLKRTLRSRLVPGGRFRAVLTRWHFDDFVAAFQDRPTYTIVHMVALSESKEQFASCKFARNDVEVAEDIFKDIIRWENRNKGTAKLWIHDRGPSLWPDYWSEADLVAEREDVGVPIFNCMYQGDPSALSGDIFTIDCFNDLPKSFDLILVKQFWDTALSERESASFTVGITAGSDADGNFYLLRVRRKHLSSKAQRDVIINAFWEDRGEWEILDQVGVEHGLLSIGLLAELAENSEIPLVEALPKGDKVARARPVAAKGEAGKFFVDKSASWWLKYLEELLSFPRGKWDDQVDGTSGVYNMLFQGGRRWKQISFKHL